MSKIVFERQSAKEKLQWKSISLIVIIQLCNELITSDFASKNMMDVNSNFDCCACPFENWLQQLFNQEFESNSDRLLNVLKLILFRMICVSVEKSETIFSKPLMIWPGEGSIWSIVMMNGKYCC
jgi:hypothetical protein